MGWTSYHASFYKNGKIDRKAECDSIMNCDMVGNKGRYEVLKSAMVGCLKGNGLTRIAVVMLACFGATTV